MDDEELNYVDGSLVSSLVMFLVVGVFGEDYCDDDVVGGYVNSINS